MESLFESITDGGVQTVIPQIAESNQQPQTVYLDFDGAVTTYRNDELGICLDNVVVSASKFTEAQISAMVDSLNQSFDGNVVFTAVQPTGTVEYSTVYVGKTSDFSDIGAGNYLGLAETIDSGNKIRNDNAFVMLDADSASAADVIEVITHEVGHIVSGTTHAGAGLDAYAYAIYVSSGRVSYGRIISSGTSMYVYSGGKATSTTVNSRGSMYVSSGGTATGTTVNSRGYMRVYSDGTATGTTVNYWGNLYVDSGGTATGTTVSGGSMHVSNGGTATDTTVNDFSYLYVSSGGTATDTTVNSWGSMYVISGGTATGTTVNSGGWMWVNSGGTATGTTVNAGGSMYVSRGGTATGTTVNAGGKMIVSSGGTANNTTVSSGYLYVSWGGTATGTTVNSWGYLSVSSGGTATGTTVNSGGSMSVYSGGTATGTTVNDIGSMWVSSGGIATAIKENGGYVYILSGATATFAPNNFSGLILSNHYATVHSGTTATGTTVNSRGYLYVSSGGTATGTTVYDFGYLSVSSGGTATDTTVYDFGYLSVFSGGTANNTTVNSGGRMYVSSGGTATCTAVNSGGRMWVYSGGTATGTTVNSRGYMFISSGGTATDTTLNSGGSMYVSNGGTVTGTTVNSGGSMELSSGAVLAGHNDIGGMMLVSGSVNASSAIVDFAVNQRTTGDTYMVSDMAYLNGASYCITVAENQNAGTYQLAAGAASFKGSITVQFESGKVIGGVTVGGTVKYFDANYTLQRTNSILSLTISYDQPTYVNNAWESLTAETVVEVPGGTAIIGTDAFADEATARAKVGADANLTMLGTQDGNLELSGASNELQNMVIGGTVSTGTATATPQNTQIAVTDTTAKRMFAGGNFNEVTQTGTAAEVTAIVTGGSFGGVFGGGDVANSKVLANTDVSVSCATTGLVFGGANLKAGTADAKNTAVLNGDTAITLTGATSSQYTCGGSLVGSYSSETRTGDITMTVDGGSFQQLVGGTLIQSSKEVTSAITGNINITIGGDAKIGTLYGGSMALKVGATRKESISGNIGITIDVSEGAAVSGMVFCGGAAYMSVDGDTNLTVKGAGKGSDFFGATVISCDSAYANWGSRYVTGDRSLSFSNFNGRCQSNIYLVDTVNVDATSEVTLTYLMSNLNGVNWNISADDVDRVSVTLAESTLGEFSVDLAGAMLNLSCELGDGDEWTVFKTANDDVLSNLGEAEICLNGDSLTETAIGLLTGDTYQLEYREDGALVASKIA